MLKGRYTFGYCQRPVFSLGVSQHRHKITSLWKFGLNRSSKLRENYETKKTPVRQICVLSDRNKRLLARSLLLFKWESTSFSKTTLPQRESFSTMFYTINCSPMHVTKSVFKLIFVLSNYQTCIFPLRDRYVLWSKMIWKAVDTIGNCQRLAFAVGVSQHMQKITNLLKFELNRS